MTQYFKTTIRHLWKARLFTSLNILGLAISLSACWIIYRIVDHEFSYDSSLKNKDAIYRVISGFIFEDEHLRNGGTTAPLYQAVREQVSGIRFAVPVHDNSVIAAEINTNNAASTVIDDPKGITETDSTYFNMLPYRWLAGNKATALNAPGSIVLTESRAKQYFPGRSSREILGQTIRYIGYGDTTMKTITGVVADLLTPTEFNAREFWSLPAPVYPLEEWQSTNSNVKLYLQLDPGASPAEVIKKIDALAARKLLEYQRANPDHFKFKRWFELMPLAESHFATDIGDAYSPKINKKLLFGLEGVSLFLLILACINYVNISVAAMPQRAKEIGVRKTLGSGQGRLIAQSLLETFLTSLAAFTLSFAMASWGFQIMSDVVPPGVTFYENLWQLAGFALVLSSVITLVAGLYPAWLITKVKTINTFRNITMLGTGRPTFGLRKILIVFQFTIALAFIVCALIVSRQLNYLIRSDMGFDKDAVILFHVPWKYQSDKNYNNRLSSLAPELNALPGVARISLANSAPLAYEVSSDDYEYKREGREPLKRLLYRKWVDTGFLGLYSIRMVAGRNLTPSDTSGELIVNETALRAYGFVSPREALGSFLFARNKTFTIVGVVKDFHFRNFYTAIDPLALMYQKSRLNTFSVKLASKDPENWHATINAIEKKWYGFYPPGSFSFKFYDETIQSMYEEEQHFARLIDMATSIAVLISCLGLFGLAVYTAFQRTKEIGIRKVLGASVSGVTWLLSKEYLALVVVSLLVASPFAWWGMNKWLDNFAYRVPVSWWIFVLSGLIGIVVAFLTVGFQAIKAARANPVTTLRTE